jgi:predicted phage terminase large subunit-like protein
MFKRDWFGIVDAIPDDQPAPDGSRPHQVVARARGWDCAATEGGGDWTVGVRMAITRAGHIYIEHVVRGQWGPAKFEGPDGIMRQTVLADGRVVRQREEQEPGSAGKKVIASHQQLLAGFDYKGEHSTGDKPTRARPFAATCAQAENGNRRVFLIRGEWNQAYLDELCTFPNGKKDDQVDASANAYNDIALGVGGGGMVKTTGH